MAIPERERLLDPALSLVPDHAVVPADAVLQDLRQAEIDYRETQARWNQQLAGLWNLRAELARLHAVKDGLLDRLAPTPQPEPRAQEAVLQDLRQAEVDYRVFQSRWEMQFAELRDLRAELVRLYAANRDLQDRLAATQQRAVEQEQRADQQEQRAREQEQRAQQQEQRADRQRERADRLAELLKEIHRSLFSGNVYDLILKACLTITGATRGLYVTARGEGDTMGFRVRAAVDMDGQRQSPPSDFIKALCRKVLDDNTTFVANGPEDLAGLPAPERPEERFKQCVAAPVVMLKHFNGIIIVADKREGEFDQEDADTLLSVGDQAAIAVENAHLRRELQKAYLSTVSVMADAMEAKDSYTQGHCEMVLRYARLIGEQLNLSAYDRSVVYYAALLHDIGKIGVSDGVLNKPGPLLPEERELVRSHVRVGRDLIHHVPALQAVANVVLHHHEWYDGSGYPDGLRGEQIPLASRIVGAVDAYCAMVTNRSYKEAYSSDWAREELRRCAGQQFDPIVVEAFLAVLALPDVQLDDEEDDEYAPLPDAVLSAQ